MAAGISSFADFSSSLRFEDLDPAAVATVKLNIFDTVACSIAGYTAVGIPELRHVVADWSGKPEATIPWSDIRVPTAQAASVNGSMCQARDCDDAHDKAILHAGVSVIPAALAAGLEMICRVGWVPRISQRLSARIPARK